MRGLFDISAAVKCSFQRNNGIGEIRSQGGEIGSKQARSSDTA